MAVITIGTGGATWGLTAETGIFIQSYSGKVGREKNEVRDNVGDVKLVSYYNPTRKVTISGVLLGATGIGAASPGAALTIANADGNNGVATGSIYVDDVEAKGTNTAFKDITVNATQYAGI